MRVPRAFAIIVLMIGCVGIVAARTLSELFLFAELVSVAAFFIFFTVLIPTVFPQKRRPEAIFIGGAAKPPYIHPEEIFSPGLPLLAGEIDEDWALYHDKQKYKPIRRVK
ncbi:MAG: hypothetical protein ACE5Z5_04500 [Candidatus Bathyarchaeia archaeon]